MSSKDRIAPEGKIFVCHACGKTSRDQYGHNKDYPGETSRGWDASCFLNSVLYDKTQLEYDEYNRVCKIKDLENED